MSSFTFGKWEHEEYIPYGSTLNGKEYLVRQGETDIALVKREDDAKLIAAAPELYWMAYNLLFELKRWNGANPEYIAQAIPQIEDLLKRIQAETTEAEHSTSCGKDMEKFIALVAEMRKSQRTYFKTRSREALIESKIKERAIDGILEKLERERRGRQS